MIDDCYIKNLNKNEASAVFHSCAIQRSVSPKSIELGTEGHKHGGRHLSLSFTIIMKNYYCIAPTQ